jgi:5,6-dimethylbenzimidazole synthase
MGCLQRGADLSTLRAALRAASRGESFLGPELDALLRPGAGEALSAREEEILGLIAEGFTSRQIGERLTLSPKTVENHRAHIKDKLSIRTTAGLVRHVLRQRERRSAAPARPPVAPVQSVAAPNPGRRATDAPGQFGPDFQAELEQLFRWRRDVRRFKREPLPPGALELLMAQANLSPSVGLSQPWRFVRVNDPARRAKIVQNFERNNNAAQREYPDEKAQLYAQLKLAGLKEAPEHLAVYADTGTNKGSGLGRRTMPEMLCYSAVTAVYTMWLAARARGWGMGWVSILNPVQVSMILEVPFGWELVAYLCIGLPEEEHLDPELQRHGWETRAPPVILER